MTAVTTLAGAPKDIQQRWHAIEWRNAFMKVRRLQMRIVKAMKLHHPDFNVSSLRLLPAV